MKKTISTIIACTVAVFTVSCSSNDYMKRESITVGDSSKMDTLSYIIGTNIGNQIIKGYVEQVKADYETIVSTFERTAKNGESIEVCGVEICKDSLESLYRQHLTQDFNSRLTKARQDSTAQIFNSDEEKQIISAIFGATIGYNISATPFPLQTIWLKAAIEDIKNNNQKFDEPTMMQFMENYYDNVYPADCQKKSEKWLKSIEKQSGVKKTASGILYKIEKAGDSKVKAIKDTDVVKVLYTGRNFYGEVFDSNRWDDMTEQRKQMIKMYQPELSGTDNPIEFPLNGVIKGWTEGMKLIGKGGKITLWIPAELAYGSRGANQQIGPNHALRFDVELLDVTNN